MQFDLLKEEVELLKKEPVKNSGKINFIFTYLILNKNPATIKILKEYIDSLAINWSYLSSNENNSAIELLKQNPDKINWNELSANKNQEAIEMLKANQDSLAIDWVAFSSNPSIFTLDYRQMMINFEPYAEEIIAKALHPKRMIRYMEQYNFEFEDWFD